MRERIEGRRGEGEERKREEEERVRRGRERREGEERRGEGEKREEEERGRTGRERREGEEEGRGSRERERRWEGEERGRRVERRGREVLAIKVCSPGCNPVVRGTACSLSTLLHGCPVVTAGRWGWEGVVRGLRPPSAASVAPLSHPASPRTTSPVAPHQGLEGNTLEYMLVTRRC